MAKVRACYEDVEAHERAVRLGRRYDFVLKLRADYSLERDGLGAAAFAATLHRSVFGMPRVSTHPFGVCFTNMDWGFVAPRALAETAFSIEQASCSWFQCIRNADRISWPPDINWYHLRRGSLSCSAAASDGILAHWFLAHGAPLEVWTLEPNASYHGIGLNRGCSFDSQSMGLISPRTHVREK